jgi:hypothetical protein
VRNTAGGNETGTGNRTKPNLKTYLNTTFPRRMPSCSPIGRATHDNRARFEKCLASAEQTHIHHATMTNQRTNKRT